MPKVTIPMEADAWRFSEVIPDALTDAIAPEEFLRVLRACNAALCNTYLFDCGMCVYSCCPCCHDCLCDPVIYDMGQRAERLQAVLEKENTSHVKWSVVQDISDDRTASLALCIAVGPE